MVGATKGLADPHRWLGFASYWFTKRMDARPCVGPRFCFNPALMASRLPSRATRASLGAGVVRDPFTVTDFHRLPSAGLPAHPSTHDPSHQAARRCKFPTSVRCGVRGSSGIWGLLTRLACSLHSRL